MGGMSVLSFGVSVILCCVHLVDLSHQQTTEELYPDRYDWVSPKDPFPTSLPGSELPGGLLTNRKMKVDRGQYTLREDLIVDTGAELILEPGVRISFAPTVGITVRGILTAKGSEKERISLTSLDISNESSEPPAPIYRLVDGSSTLSGRLQTFYKGKWRSVCSNSRRWSTKDVEVVCREMGWLGGAWVGWTDREAGQKPRLLLLPNCTGTENSLSECEHSPRQMGGPTCDFHPDIVVECFPQHVTSKVQHHWRGLRFENAQFRRYLTLSNTFYVPFSYSSLRYVDIRFAGSGKDYNASSAIEVSGVPPEMISITVYNSAYNGINVTEPVGPVYIYNSSISNNRGYGIFVNSSDGGVHVEGGHIAENGGDGIRYFGHEYILKDRKNVFDLCTLPTTSSQTFPLLIELQQDIYSANRKDCEKYIYTQPGYVLTVNFLRIRTNNNGTAKVAIHDGISSSDRQLASFSLFNSTKPQSLTTVRSNVFIRFNAAAFTDTYALIRVTSGVDKWYDLNVTDTNISDNNGRGIAIENLRSRLGVLRTSVSHNNHVAGIHVKNGAGHVNITESRIAFNVGDGVNVTYAGGSTNVSRSTLSSNEGFGAAVWYNETQLPEFLSFNQTVVVQYSAIFKNILQGVYIGNFSRDSTVNITGNEFNSSLSSAVEVHTSWKENGGLLNLFIGHNQFQQNKKLGIKIRPAVNIEALIEFNQFVNNHHGCILIKNDPLEVFEVLPSKFLIRNNEFYHNQGTFVVNLGLSAYSELHKILFTWNYVKHNKISEPFGEDRVSTRLIPRSRVAAPVVVSSDNTDIFRNIIQNSQSQYEIGVHIQDQSQSVNCTYNWLGYSDEEKIYYRLFDRKERYNLARIEYIPFLLHSSYPGATTIMPTRLFVPQFNPNGGTTVGGEVEGLENLRPGEYTVERDINIRPEGRLNLEPGVTLRFPPGVGIMVGGKLEARGRRPNDILLTLREEVIEEESTTIVDDPEAAPAVPSITKPQPKVRLIGGQTSNEGTLQVFINNQWGTVCNYGWNKKAASLVCNQLGLVLNPNDWLLYRSDIPHSGTNDPILLTNVDCSDEHYDVTECKAQRAPDFENACNHLQDVLMRCYQPHWAGMRMGALAETSHLQYLTIQQAGILDYATNEFKPALQVDVAKHTLENVKLVYNAHDGLGIVYSDIFAPGVANTVKNCEFSDNKGSGVSFKQVGLRITGTKIENNRVSGIRHDPVMSALAQREFAGWFQPLAQTQPRDSKYKPLIIPYDSPITFKIEEGNTKYVITQRMSMNVVQRTYTIMCNPGFVIGIQLLNPIHNRSTEQIIIHDALDMNTKADDWVVSRDLNVFPVTSTSFGVVMHYKSGNDALGMVVLALSVIRAPVQNIPNRIIKGPVPTLAVFNSRIKGNAKGIWASYYNRYFTELGDYYLRKSNESIHVVGCDISFNKGEAVYIDAPFWSKNYSNISEITLVFNSSLITDNGRGLYQFSRDLRNSTNLFHWKLNDNTIERNAYGGYEIYLPYVWQYNENFTHSVSLRNNTWRNNRQFFIKIGGHFALVNISDSMFVENVCRTGLISLQGMEKYIKINNNIIEKNYGLFMLEFKADSQSEIMGDLRADFIFNAVQRNKPPAPETPSSVILFDGVQRVRVRRNLISDNLLTYALVAGVRTARVDSPLDVSENWWGTQNTAAIKKLIFDFDDWNDHAMAIYTPYLVEEAFEGSLSIAWEKPEPMNTEILGGRLLESMTLYPQARPYKVMSDLTVMPGVMLTITPGVEMEFAPRVGLLILGTLMARGARGREIIMRPLSARYNEFSQQMVEQTVRLCTPHNCTGDEGFVEMYNSTTQQWVPVCDSRFSERNAEVTCRQLQRDTLDIFVGRDRRYDLHPGDTSRIWSWHEPLQCTGEEKRLEECEVRLNGQVYGHIHKCNWDDQFVFVRCGPKKLYNNWGGVRFANSDFEQSDFENRIHDVVTHTTLFKTESIMEFVVVKGAGLLHSQKSPAILSITRSPEINNVNISSSADHGISLIAPNDNVRLLFNSITNNYGVGVNIASITGEGRESIESSFTPLKDVLLPYRAFSLVDMCDPSKEIVVQERLIIYYVYDNRPINCVKIFYSAYHFKPFGFRLLQFNLYNSTDRLDLYDGGLFNHSVKLITSLSHGNPHSHQKFVKTLSPRLSVRLVASAASQAHGFIAEIVTLPISAIGFNRDVQHNVSYSVIAENKRGAIQYSGAGEVNPRLTIEKNQIRDNCFKMYGNFSSCYSSVHLDLQNTQNLHFRNNLVMNNQGGVFIRADSRSSATSLKGWIHNNLFADNKHKPALSVEGRQSSPYQQVTIYNNYWKGNWARYENTINLNQVVSNFTYNFVYGNTGSHILEISGFERVRLPIYQSTSHNGFYWNYAADPCYRATIVAGTAGQHYVDNIFYNPDNDYEISTVNQSYIDVLQSPIDAKHNYWGYNQSLAVMGRIRDRYDQANLLAVNFKPYLMNNSTVLDVKCPPGWNLVGDTCYIYIGAPMSFFQARDFCRSTNASMPYVMGNYLELYRFLKKQQETYQFYDRVWVQHIDKINQCTTFTFQRIEIDYCDRLSPFICEMDPKVIIDALSWRTDVVAVAMIGSVLLLILLIALLIVFWVSKSRHRQAQRLERRNSIRQSLNSVRSFGSSRAFGDMYRKGLATSTQSSPTLNKNTEYKKMAGSLDSIEKSQFNSSNEEDTQSYDIYEAHNPTTTEAINTGFDLSYRNQGFRDNSTFASQDNSTWRTDDYNNTSTLPLNTSLIMTDSTIDIVSKSDYQQEPDYQVFYERPKSSTILETNLDDSLPPAPMRAQSENLLETNFDTYPSQDMRTFQPLSKSQPLETAM